MDTINTIFYFPESLTFEDYSNKLNRGEISGRTIVLANEQKAIYKNGKKYGGLDEQELRAFIDSLSGNSWISDEIDGAKGDITRISELEALLQNLINLTKLRLDEEIENKDSDIQLKVEELMVDAQWIQENFPQGVTEWDDGWNSELEAYLRRVGYWTTDNNGNTVTQWSKLQLSVDNITSEVNNLTENGTLTTSLSATIELKIQDDIAKLALGTTYAKKDAETVIEWLYSGLKSSSSPNKTFNQLSSMAKNGSLSAIADIRTYVEKLHNGDYVASSELSTKVGEYISGVLTLAGGDGSLASLYALSDDNNTHISLILLGLTNSDSTTSIKNRIKNKLAEYETVVDFNNSITTIRNAVLDSNGNYISSALILAKVSTIESLIAMITGTGSNTAGFITKSNLDSAISEMFAGDVNGDKTASIITSFNNVTGSEAVITADKIAIDGYLTGGNASFKGNIQASSFLTGTKKQNGIVVLSEEFDPSIANKKKAYFAYDSTLGAITMYFYQNKQWKRVDLSKSAIEENPNQFRGDTYYKIDNYLSNKVIPIDLLPTTAYVYRLTDLAYTEPSTASDKITGYYITGQSYTRMLTVLQKTINGGLEPMAGTLEDGLWKTGWLASNVLYGVSMVREIHSDGTSVRSGMLCMTPPDLRTWLTIVRFNSDGEIADKWTIDVIIGIRDLYLDANGNIKKAVLAPVACIESNIVNSTTLNTNAVFKRANSKKSSIGIGYDGTIALRDTQNSLYSKYYIYCHYAPAAISKALTATTPDDYTRSNRTISKPFNHIGTATVINPTSTGYPYPYSSSLSSYSGTQFYI